MATVATSIYPRHREFLPDRALETPGYILRFAENESGLDKVLRLRYEVFNQELGEGFAESHATGRDEDGFDAQCHHMMVEHRGSGEIIGTYRLQTAEMAAGGRGLYSDGEYDLGGLPASVRASAVELGRACIARDHRNRGVLQLLWRGIALYLFGNHRRYLIGCCSLTSQDPREGATVMEYLRRSGHVHPEFLMRARQGFECASEQEMYPVDEVRIPLLFRSYLKIGTKVCSEPAIDRDFRTIDYLVILDVASMDPAILRMYAP